MSRILIIEDEAAIRRVLGKIISEESDSYKVEEAEDGLRGIELIKDNDYDLVLCDIKMPKMDGMEATREIRDIEGKSGMERTPIVALTAHAMDGDKDRILAAGIDYYLTKPLKKKEIFQKIVELSPADCAAHEEAKAALDD